nr:uncharacterized protein LOC116818890 [Chelonoidis abingdonii]
MRPLSLSLSLCSSRCLSLCVPLSVSLSLCFYCVYEFASLLRSEALAQERRMPHALKTEAEASPLRMINNFLKVKGAFVRQLLTTNLETLRKDQFENFRDVLCKTPVKDLVRAGDEFLDEPNTFHRDASLETIVEDLIGKCGRTYALTAAATVMEKIGRRDLAKELQGEEEALHVTECLRRKPKGEVNPEDRFLLWISPRFSLHFILPTTFFEGIPALERHSSKG